MARSQRPASIPINGHNRLNGYGKGLKGWDDTRDWRDVRDEAGPVRGKPGGSPTKGGGTHEPPARPVLKVDDVRPKGPGQAAFMEAMRGNRVCWGLGPQGSGKTFLAVWNAVRLLDSGQVDGITLFRPAREVGETLGFQPGKTEEKIAGYMAPMLKQLAKFYPAPTLKSMIRDKVIETEALQFLRGDNIERRAAILDEGQNCLHQEIQMFLGRLCEGSYFSILGDVSRNEPGHPCAGTLKQSDLPPHLQGGLEYYAGKFLSIKGIARVEMTSVDVARDPLVKMMLDAGL